MEAAGSISDRLAMIHGGRVVEHGTFAQFNASRNEHVHTFLNIMKSPEGPDTAAPDKGDSL